MLSLTETKMGKYGIFASVVLSLLCNGFVIYVVLIRLRSLKKLRQSNLLVCHLAVAALGLATINLFNTSNVVSFVNVPESLCSTVGYLKSVFYVAYFLSILAIAYERLHCLRKTGTYFDIYHTISAVWIVSLVFSIPSAGTTAAKSEYLQQNETMDKNDSDYKGNCQAVNLGGSLEATIIYELCRFSLFNVGVALYMLYAVRKIQSYLKQLRKVTKVPSEKMQRKLRSIRLIYFHCISFVCLSVPIGASVLVRRISNRASVDRYGKLIESSSFWSVCSLVITYGSFFYFLLTPLFSLLLLEGKTVWCRWSFQISEQDDASSQNGCCKLFSTFIPRCNLCCQWNKPERSCDESSRLSTINSEDLPGMIGVAKIEPRSNVQIVCRKETQV